MSLDLGGRLYWDAASTAIVSSAPHHLKRALCTHVGHQTTISGHLIYIVAAAGICSPNLMSVTLQFALSNIVHQALIESGPGMVMNGLTYINPVIALQQQIKIVHVFASITAMMEHSSEGLACAMPSNSCNNNSLMW